MQVVLLDIEGTTSSIAFVYDVMFSYARRRLADYLVEQWDEPTLREVRAQIAADAGKPALVGAEPAELAVHLAALMDQDAKATGLKQLQGMIWEGGFHGGELQAHLFEDVAPAIQRWVDAGLRVAIYSSGSIAAQRLFFGHTEYGDLTPLLSGHFDTTNGPKREAASYRRIAEELGVDSTDVLFLSDVVAELQAAAEAGMRVGLMLRPGNHPQPLDHGFPEYETFDSVDTALGVGS